MILYTTEVEIAGVVLRDPVTAITNVMIFALSLFCYLKLNKRDMDYPHKNWNYFFLLIGISSLVGTVVHGFSYYTSPHVHFHIWWLMGIIQSAGFSIAQFGVGSNVFLKFLLYAEFGAAGLAYATAMGAWVTFAILGYLGFRKKYLRIDRSLIRIIFSTLISACILASFTYFMSSTIFNSIIYNEKLSAVLNLIALSVSGFVIYSTCFLSFIKMIFRSKISWKCR